MLRKVLTLVLLVVFGLPLISPVFAAGADEDSGVPVCCRRSGSHQCMLSPAQRRALSSESGMELRKRGTPCPFRPQAMTAAHSVWATPAMSSAIFADLVKHPTGTAQTESKKRISENRSRQKRGPPAHISAL